MITITLKIKHTKKGDLLTVHTKVLRAKGSPREQPYCDLFLNAIDQTQSCINGELSLSMEAKTLTSDMKKSHQNAFDILRKRRGV